MCLAIPGRVLEIVDAPNRIAKVDVAGVVRNVNVGLLDGQADRRFQVTGS
jgi:hydrogenase expression/formation protein HypC